MGYETSTTSSPAVNNEVAIKTAADEMIRQAAAKKGWSVADMPQEAVDDAYKFVRETIESDQRNQSNEYFHLYQKEKSAREASEAMVKAGQQNREARTDNRVVQSMERTRDLMGRATWFQLSEGQKIAAIGVDPKSVDRAQVRNLFGKGADSAAAVDLMKVSPFLYRQLREVSLILDITGK